MKDASDLRSKAKSRRRDRRQLDRDNKNYGKDRPKDKQPYDRNAFKKGTEDK
jgi:hypothetical protein